MFPQQDHILNVINVQYEQLNKRFDMLEKTVMLLLEDKLKKDGQHVWNVSEAEANVVKQTNEIVTPKHIDSGTSLPTVTRVKRSAF